MGRGQQSKATLDYMETRANCGGALEHQLHLSRVCPTVCSLSVRLAQLTLLCFGTYGNAGERNRRRLPGNAEIAAVGGELRPRNSHRGRGL